MMLIENVRPAVSTRPMPLPLRRNSMPDDAARLPRVLLASRSPRRRLMLEQAHIDHEVVDSGIDDGQLTPGNAAAEQWVVALAYMKAAAALTRLGDRAALVRAEHGEVVLGADTVVVDEGQIIGQPRDRDDAERILRRLINGEHDVLTGVAIVEGGIGGRRDLFLDRAHVTVGVVAENDLKSYLDSGQWRGKAGAYNLAERLQAGWPITVSGDPGTVMGLPMGRLAARLERFAE